MSNPMNREGWLTAFAEAIAPVIKQRTGHTVPMHKIRLSCSFPMGRSTPNKNGKLTTGECVHGDTHKSGLHELMINPLKSEIIRDDGHGIAETVIHELIHASLNKGVGHKAPFARAAKLMGLEGKPTATNAGPELVKTIRTITDKIGPYPHKAIDGDWGRKQTTRLLKVQCTDCGYINEQGNGYTARITMTWIENAGLPTCPCGATMSLIDDGAEVPLVALKPVESHATYQVPFLDDEAKPYGIDPRFQIRRTSSERHGDRWTVMDFGDGAWGTSTPRIVSAESRANALDLISAIREGLYRWDYLEDDQGWDEEDDGKNPLTDDETLDRLLYVPEDEDEEPDHPEDQDAGEWTHPITGKVVRFDYDAVARSRE